MYIPLPLETVQINVPVPINIWDARGYLLLRKGDLIESEQHRDNLMRRGPMAKESDYEAWNYSYTMQIDRMVRSNSHSLSEIADAPLPMALPEAEKIDPLDHVLVWPDLQTSLTMLLHRNVTAAGDFAFRIGRVELKAKNLLADSVDKAVFVLLQLLFDRNIPYSATHALLTACIAHEIGRAAGLADSELESLFRAAMTMNIGMARLHDKLARQDRPPSDEQKAEIAQHPLSGVQILKDLEVADPLWLSLVEEHHEQTDGKGYPHGKRELATVQQILQLSDVFVARISPRRTRRGSLINVAARDIYLGRDGKPNPLGALLVKTLGIYPPGSYVTLASGEVAVVARRGRRANAPEVFAIIGRSGMPLGEPAWRDSLERTHEVKAAVSPDDVKVRINARRLLDLA